MFNLTIIETELERSDRELRARIDENKPGLHGYYYVAPDSCAPFPDNFWGDPATFDVDVLELELAKLQDALSKPLDPFVLKTLSVLGLQMCIT